MQSFQDKNRGRIAVTGAQGVGKSTFCKALTAALAQAGIDVSLRAGLGDGVRKAGFAVGREGTSDTIHAIFAAHLERELDRTSFAVFDRCVIDALAYARCLNVSSAAALKLYTQITLNQAANYDLVVHLRRHPSFLTSNATHETPELRRIIDEEIALIISSLNIRSVEADAASNDAVQQIVDRILE